MGLGPIWRSLRRNRTSPLLVMLQIAVTLAVVVNSLYIIKQRIDKIGRPTGIDVANVIIVDVRGFGEGFDVVSSIRNDIDLLRNMPGIVTATVSNHAPLSGSGSGTGLRVVPDEEIDDVDTARYRWSEEGLDALGVELTRGRNFLPSEVDYIVPGTPGVADHAPASVLVTQALADELFPDEDALGNSDRLSVHLRTDYWLDSHFSVGFEANYYETLSEGTNRPLPFSGVDLADLGGGGDDDTWTLGYGVEVRPSGGIGLRLAHESPIGSTDGLFGHRWTLSATLAF